MSHLRAFFASVAAALDKGGITPHEARVMVDMTEVFQKLLEVTEIDTRISALEQRNAT